MFRDQRLCSSDEFRSEGFNAFVIVWFAVIGRIITFDLRRLNHLPRYIAQFGVRQLPKFRDDAIECLADVLAVTADHRKPKSSKVECVLMSDFRDRDHVFAMQAIFD